MQTFRIGIDLRLIQTSFLRGMGRYTLQQLHAVIANTPQHHYVLFCLHRIPPILHPLLAYPNVTTETRFPRYSLRIFGKMPHLANATTRQLDRMAWHHQLDLLHIPILFNFVQPMPTTITACPVVVTLYDYIPQLFPDQLTYMMPHQWAEYARGLDFLRRVTGIIAISHATKADALRLQDIPPERITVAYPVPDPMFAPLPSDQTHAQLSSLWQSLAITPAPSTYMFAISDHFYTKNLDTLLRAYADLPPAIRESCPLVVTFNITPQDRARFEALCADFGIYGQVIFTGRVDEAQLVALYNGALCSVYPSRYEGFGYPIAEAFACGTPVITSDASCLPEVAGDAALICSPDDVAGITDAMRRLYEDEALRQHLRDKGFAQVTRFSTHALQTQTLLAYHTAIGQGRHPRPPMPPHPPIHHRLLLALWRMVSDSYYRRTS